MPTRTIAGAPGRRARAGSWGALAVAALNVPIQFWDHASERSPWFRSEWFAALMLCSSMACIVAALRTGSGRAKRVLFILQGVSAIALCAIILYRWLQH